MVRYLVFSVLWIRIRSNPELFGQVGSRIILPYPDLTFCPNLTVFVRISDMARISASFGLFHVLWRYFEMRYYFNDVKVPKNAQDQCEFECLFLF
jgi:hypothetical protein